MTSTARDRLVAAALVLTGAAAVWSGLRMSQESGIFPIVMGALLLVASLAHLLIIHAKGLVEEEPEAISRPRLAVAGGLAFAFSLLIEPLGMYVAMPVYLFVAILILSRLGWLASAVIGLGFSAVIFVIFDLLLEVPTPPGLLEFLFNG